MSESVPLPRPGSLGLIQYAGVDMLQYAAAVSAAKDAEIAGLREFCQNRIDDIETLRTALHICREYPDFDEGGPIPEMIDAVLAGKSSPMIEAYDNLQRMMDSIDDERIAREALGGRA